MRRARLRIPEDRPVGYYHCISRVVDRRFIFEEHEKEHFVRLLREYERFCRVRVLTFCIMSNHFHVLVEVPKRPEVLPGPEEIVENLRRLSGHHFPEVVRQRFEMFRQADDEKGLAAYLAGFHARMYDVSAFMKLVKQRFTQWYNVRVGRKGTLWEDRFKSVLVDGAGRALATMAAYIDLNPIRAGIVRDPKDYRWSGYGEAMAGRKRAKVALQFVVTAARRGTEETISRSLETYRQYLYLEGDERRESVNSDGRLARGALPAEEVEAVLKATGRLPLASYLHCRVRYFCDGAVFGSREFVEDVFRAYRARFGPKRSTGARPMRGLTESTLFTLRDLRVGVFGSRQRG
ncbi:MAG: transposase [Verrucomicrobiales bacterium]|nr:transposase [Verrucomicrobiales bacterium]